LSRKTLRSVKPEIRVVGVDDGYFVPHTKGKCDVIGVVYRGGYWLDGVMRTQIEIDGMDATEKIADMILRSSHHGQLRVVLLDGVTFAGFNVVDTLRLREAIQLPIIAITREKPDLDDIRKALGNLPFGEERWTAIQHASKLVEVPATKGRRGIFMQVVGISDVHARRIIRQTATRSSVPEALRVAHLIASGLTKPLQK
jgi:endonuclease V-like protein UPF0215 family